MPRPRSAMRKIREVLRLSLGEGLSPRQVAISLALSRITIRRYLERARLAGITWPLPDELDDVALEARLFAPPPPPGHIRPLPDWAEVHHELRSKKNVTLQLLHLEYKERCPSDGYQYSQFCLLYRAWLKKVDVVMRQEHKAGERCFVDWAGQTVPIIDPRTGELAFEAQIFVAVLGASSHTYAEAFPSQELEHWISAHIHAFEAWGACPRICVPDNPRTGVTQAHRYEPVLKCDVRRDGRALRRRDHPRPAVSGP